MGRIILGVIAGFVVWSIVWVGSAQVLGAVWPEYSEYNLRAERAIANGESLDTSWMIALVNLIRSFITSILAGYMAALVAGEYGRTTLALGVILVLVGIGVEYGTWNLAPAWYHILFVLFLLPMTVLGGKLRRPN
jgi:hypothetical protein